MDRVLFNAPEAHNRILADLRMIPFAKTEKGLVFASWVYDLGDSEAKRQEILGSPNGKRAMELMEQAKADLEANLIMEDDYLSWTVHKKEGGGIARYHEIIRKLSIDLLMLSINFDPHRVENEHHQRDKTLYNPVDPNTSQDVKYVLNRHNPFADVTIKSQQYFYISADGNTETLFFNTNNIVEKLDKNGKDMFTMRPGFSVTKEHGVAQKPMQKVTFASSITEPIIGDEDHIYVHID